MAGKCIMVPYIGLMALVSNSAEAATHGAPFTENVETLRRVLGIGGQADPLQLQIESILKASRQRVSQWNNTWAQWSKDSSYSRAPS
jgi:hypothetical protein